MPAIPVTAVVQESLVLSPAKIIAPVGSQVVLLAGLRGANGQFSPGQPIEWVLSQESVGHFVEVGDECDYLLCHWRHRAPRKLSNNYAIGRTSRHDQVITRGNANPADDVWLMRGQAWISVSSPSEGVSLVTAMAPEAPGWDQRQQTAEIYWVNAQWTLPAPAHVRAGQPHALTTVVTRPGSMAPVAGWIVRYEVAGGSPAAFTSAGDQAIDVVTDATGAATAQILPQMQGAGVTQVRVQIIRPGAASHEPSRLIVGEGSTTVAWSAPGLTVTITGPSVAAVGATLPYRIDVTNTGDMPATDVTLTYNAPPGVTILNSNPPGSVFGQRVEWRLGELTPRAARSFEVNCRADQQGDFNHCAVAQSPADNLSAENCVLTRVMQQSLSLSMTGPEEAEVGQEVQYVVTVRNEGGVELTDVIVTDRFDEGLQHAVSASPIERPLGTIAPGEQKQFAITFQVTRAGRWCHTMTATTALGQTASARACLTAREAPPPQLTPGLAVRVWGPRDLPVGQVGEYFVEVANTGQTPLTALRVAVSNSPSLQPTTATAGDNRQQVGNQLIWTLERLEVGAARRFQVNCQAVQVDPQARVRAEATSHEQVQHAAEAITQVVAPPPPATQQAPPPQQAPPVTQPPPMRKPEPSEPSPAPMPADTGELQATVDDLADSVRLGQTVTYVIVIKNTRTVADQNVSLTITLPENATLVRLNGPSGIRRVSPDGRTLDVAPVLEIRAGETLPPYRVEVSYKQPGRAVFRAQIFSARQPQPLTVEEETTILAQ